MDIIPTIPQGVRCFLLHEPDKCEANITSHNETLRSFILVIVSPHVNTPRKTVDTPIMSSMEHSSEPFPHLRSCYNKDTTLGLVEPSSARTLLMDIAQLNDEAIFKWVLTPGGSLAHVESLLTEALDRINALSRDLLARKTYYAADDWKTPSSSSSSSFVLPLSVDIDARTTTVSYDKAFLLKSTVQCGHSSTIQDSVSLVAAVVFYNIALFFHHRVALQATDDQQSLGTSMVMQYYEVANDILGQYIDRTRRPLWALQAALWYNLAECARFHTITPSSCVYFGQLEAIVGYLVDKDDRVFFERAVVMARMQMEQCFCATVA
jgi:hypothetical protein